MGGFTSVHNPYRPFHLRSPWRFNRSDLTPDEIDGRFDIAISDFYDQIEHVTVVTGREIFPTKAVVVNGEGMIAIPVFVLVAERGPARPARCSGKGQIVPHSWNPVRPF